MKPKVYIETTIVSYLTARPSRDAVVVARQQVTSAWWRTRRGKFQLFVSRAVLAEVRQGDAEAAARRIEAMRDIPWLEVTVEAVSLGERLIREGGLPAKATDDALHVALAAVHAMDYLLTWNCKHIDNAEMKPTMRTICMLAGHPCPEICTPEELMGGTTDE
jgi:predicted nucleic acid-binding protein